MNRIPVCVTGLGAVTPLGNTVEETFTNAVAGKSGIVHVSEFAEAGLTCQIAGTIKNLNVAERLTISTKDVRRLDPSEQYALIATNEAVRDARLDELTGDEKRFVGIRIGTGIGGLQAVVEGMEKFISGGKISPTTVVRLTANMSAHEIASRFGFHGPGAATASACSSSADALADAYTMIQAGEAKIVVVTGTEAGVCPFGMAMFDAMRGPLCDGYNETPERGSRPFDSDRTGFVMGEGAASIVLETEKSALLRGATVHARFAGYGRALDGYHHTAPDPAGTFAALAIERALAHADRWKHEVGYINAHGTGTPLNDVAESHAIQSAFDEDMPYSKDIWVSSTKSMTGHLLGAAGALESLLTILSLKHNTLLPTINLDQPDPLCDLRHVAKTRSGVSITTALSSSFGFGGSNVCLVFDKA